MSDPKGIWTEIKAEPDTIKGIYQKYLIPMAVIPAVCGFVGMVVVGVSIPFIGTFRWPFLGGFFSSVVSYGLTLVFAFVSAKIIKALAPKFGGEISDVDALKTIAYSMTPALVGGIFSLIPALSIFGALLGIYSLYVLYQALPRMTGVIQDKAAKFFGATLLCNIGAGIVLGLISMAVTPTPPIPEIDFSKAAENLNLNSAEISKGIEHFQKAFEGSQNDQRK